MASDHGESGDEHVPMQNDHDDDDLQYDDDGLPLAIEVVLDGKLYRAKPKNDPALLARYLE
eukprot:5765423-Prymnesium_polylepis.1